MNLTDKQKEALHWLAEAPWTAAWWGGKPHGRWPKQMPAATYNSLSLKKMIVSGNGPKWPDRTIKITDAGREAIQRP